MLALLLTALTLPEIGVGLAAGADLASTEVALRRYGLVEGNPALQEPAVRLLAKAAITTGVIAGSQALRRRGRHGTAKAVCWTAVGIWAGAAAWNVRQMHLRR